MSAFLAVTLLACGTEVVAPNSPRAAVQGGFGHFVAEPNAAASGQTEHAAPEAWDTRLEEHVLASVEQHVAAWAFFERLEAVTDDYATTLEAVRSAQLPDVLAAVPYLESRYRTDAQSVVCSRGPWQFMPEVAHRVGLKVEGCSFFDEPGAEWSPTLKAPPTPIFKASAYARDGECRIDACRIDEREDLARSTEAALGLFQEVWADPELRSSGALVQLTVASHNAGYDDSRFIENGSRFNVRPAFRIWSTSHPASDLPRFVGANINSQTPADRHAGESLLAPETQHYVYTVIAQHLLAACYYGANHGERSVFAPYGEFSDPGGWCTAFSIPSRAAVLDRG